MSKSITIIDGHPDPEEGHLCHALSSAYAKGAQAGGHEVSMIRAATLDLPLLRRGEEFASGSISPVIRETQDAIRRASHLVIVYPLWLGAMPALLKGFFEQVFRPDFAFDEKDTRWPKPMLTGRSARVIVTMGMPALAYRWYYGAHSLKSLERNILRFVGIKPVRRTLFGMVDEASDIKRAAWLQQIEALGRDGR